MRYVIPDNKVRRYEPTQRTSLHISLAIALSALLLAGCELDRRAIAPWRRAEVHPALVCPGDLVTVDWEMGVTRAGCLSDSDEGVRECRGFATITSSPNVFVPPAPSDDHTGTEIVAVSSSTTFTFNGRQDGTDWPTEVRTVDVLAERALTTTTVLFEGICSGSTPSWTPVEVISDSSEYVQVEGICNPNGFPVQVNSSAHSRSVTLEPGGCSSDLDGKPGTLTAFPLGLSPLVAEADCSPTRAIPPRGLELEVGLRCSTTGSASMEVVAGTPDDEEDELATFVTDTPPPATPTVSPIYMNFNADAYSIIAGECTTLRWEVLNADGLTLDGEPVAMLEAEQVCPPSTATYRMVASNAVEETDAFVTIEVTAPLVVPDPPEKFNIVNQVCSDQTYSVELVWLDSSDNEDGFKVYRDGNVVATLGPNSTGFTDQPPYGGPYTYGVEAFNSAGSSSRRTVEEPGCIY